MLIVPDLSDEAERLRILGELDILDSPPDRNLDDITELAAHICRTPIALITLIDQKRQWFKSRVGLEIEQTPRDVAFCVHAVAHAEDIFIVPDALADPRFRDNPLVRHAPHIRFYAGAPLLTAEGVGLGTLCVIDRVPRTLGADQVGALQALRRYVITELEQKRLLASLSHARASLEQAREALTQANTELERKVAERTASLSAVNFQLVQVATERAHAEAALRASEERFRATFNQAAVGIAHVGPDGRWLTVNDRLCQIVGYRREELLARSYQDITHPADLEKDLALVEQLTRGEIDYFTLEKRYVHKLGHEVWVDLTVSLVRTPQGNPDYFIAVIEDVTQRVRAMLFLHKAETRLRSAAEIAALGYWEWNPEDNSVYFSPEFKRLLGYAEDEMPDRFDEWEDRLHPDDRQRIRATFSRFTHAGSSELQTEFRLLHKDGSYRWIAARAVRPPDGDEDAGRVIVTHLDISDTKTAEQRVREAALHDPLTGLPNRALIFEYASHVVAGARRHGEGSAIMFIDLDRFKIINDTYGHKTGDAVLQEVAQRLTRATRAHDVVGRLGGDEFLVILPDVGMPQGAEHVARHLLEAINQPINIGGLSLYVSPSIGICDIPRQAAGVDDLIRYADLAMYRAKQAGQNRYEFFSDELEREYSESLSIEKQLKVAMLAEAFELRYQPIVDIASGQVVSVEALLRWPGKAGASIGPSQFIPIAEAAGLIGMLSEWAITEAYRQHHEWVTGGLPAIPIALNISPVQFLAREFGDQFAALLRNENDPACILQIEVTESMLMQDIEQASRVLLRLKELGCKVALDDFGTGYSSLAYLSQLPLDKLKVDQSFVRRLHSDPTCAAITAAIIALGRTLKLQVVAEGIESQSTMEYVRDLGCDQGQGYYYSRPLTGDQFARWHEGYASRPARQVRH